MAVCLHHLSLGFISGVTMTTQVVRTSASGSLGIKPSVSKSSNLYIEFPEVRCFPDYGNMFSVLSLREKMPKKLNALQTLSP
uniref:Secreted protein n=1 Tax=Steinernema glaseri TaxID=37863 RepID=A0A1I8AU47_9BILA